MSHPYLPSDAFLPKFPNFASHKPKPEKGNEGLQFQRDRKKMAGVLGKEQNFQNY
jgi:hypothetical protein